ncbi:MAG: CoA ester lyase [Deltaproteobacteria bacterium]|nr:CoA ester lyase [Deltaproteobacteria bacterium]
MAKLRRSRIYLPGNRPRVIQKGTLLGADVVILDLEDSVAPDEKDAARILVTNAIKSVNFGAAEVMVRINPLTTCGREDLAAVLPVEPDAIVVPKSENREGVQVVERAILESKLGKRVAILPLIESAKGILNAYDIASASTLVEAITFGGEDFTKDIGATRTREGQEIFVGRSLLVIAAKAAGVQALDTVFSDFNDMEGLRKDTLAVKQMGFDGRAAIHPSQIEVIHEVFTPTEKEIQAAVNVIRAAEIARKKGSGVAVVKGKMIDKPVIERAEKVICIAERLSLPIPEPEG